MKKIKFERGFYKTVLLFSLFFASRHCLYSQSKPWPVPDKASSAKNPLTADAKTAQDGKALYITYCAPCHGNNGKGDGPAAAALSVKPANHTSAAIQSETEGSLFYKISEGRPPMPPYKSALSESQRWSLAGYIKTLGKKS